MNDRGKREEDYRDIYNLLYVYNLLYADKNLKSLETIVNCELIKVVGWLIANKLLLIYSFIHIKNALILAFALRPMIAARKRSLILNVRIILNT